MHGVSTNGGLTHEMLNKTCWRVCEKGPIIQCLQRRKLTLTATLTATALRLNSHRATRLAADIALLASCTMDGLLMSSEPRTA